MRSLAFYGKGGVGKSTVVSNLTATLARMGRRVLQVGCDPKRDSSRNLVKHFPPITLMDLLAAGKQHLKKGDLVMEEGPAIIFVGEAVAHGDWADAADVAERTYKVA